LLALLISEMVKKIVRPLIYILLAGVIIFLFRPRIFSPLEKIVFSPSLHVLPYYTFCSLYRMWFAYLVAFFFSLIYGYLAATHRPAERVMLPVLDILQSVPVLGFFPAAVYLFIRIFGGTRVGIETASIFLIFTSQAWNMAFGVYESLTTLPPDLVEASEILGVKGWLRFKRLLFPACIPKIIYNSMLSWAGGWYFLIACEIISLGPISYKLPGLGSFLLETSIAGQWGMTLLGLGILILVIVLLDLIIWEPLAVWAEKFRYEFTAPERIRTPFFQNWWRHFFWVRQFKSSFRQMTGMFFLLKSKLSFLNFLSPKFFHSLDIVLRRKKLGKYLFYIIMGSSLFLSLWGLVNLFRQPLPHELIRVPGALMFSAFRLLIAYFISISWTLPAAVLLGENRRLAEIFTPLAQIAASVPATALFPFFLILLIRVAGGMNVASILLILTGMQWYLFFNLMAGIKNIPEDMKEAVRSVGVRRSKYWRKLLIPATFPSLVTGSITAWGGGWNALIISEYIVYRGKTYRVFGIGSLLSEAVYRSGNFPMIFFSLVSLIAVIILMNRFFWRRLYNWSAQRYHIEY